MNDRHLVLAYSFHPLRGSESAVGWIFAKIHSEYTETTLYTQARAYKGNIDEKCLPDNLNVIYFEGDKFETILKISGWLPWNIGSFLKYLYWHYALFKKLRKSGTEQYSLCHIVTWVSAIYPLATLFLPMKVIWGPVGGVAKSPLGFYRNHGIANLTKEAFRLCIIKMSRFNPLLRMALKRTKLVIVAAQDCKDWLVKRKMSEASKIVRIPGITYPEALIGKIQKDGEKENRDKIVISVASRLIAWKGVDILLDALAKVEKKDIVVNIFGDGEYKSTLESQAAKLELGDRVIFHGRQDRGLVLSELAYSDAFILPSLHDSEAGSCMEAAALGTPLITTAFGGVESCLEGCDKVTILRSKHRDDMVDELALEIKKIVPREDYFVSNVPENSRLHYEQKKIMMFKIFDEMKAQ